MKAFTVGFFAVLVLMLLSPWLNEQFHLFPEKISREKRRTEKKPDFSFSSRFTKKYDAYFSDHFGFRIALIEWGSTEKARWFRASPQPLKALFGSNDWLFFNDTSDRVVQSYTHRDLLDEYELKDKLRIWEFLRDSCARDSIVYIKAIWPDKHTIYPEYMPWVMRYQIKDTLSLTDQLVAYHRLRKSTVPLIDVRNAMLQEKPKETLYLKHDTHWNSMGAFVAYTEFMRQAKFPSSVRILKKSDFEITYQPVHTGDLLDICGLGPVSFLTDVVPLFTPKRSVPTYTLMNAASGFPENTYLSKNPGCGNTLRVLVFRDSYMDAEIPFFSLSFYEVYYLWYGFDFNMIQKIKPDIVIDACVERYL